MEKVLLDSTYLLPMLGIIVKNTERTLKVLGELYVEGVIEIYYTCFNFLEIIWKLSEMKYDMGIISIGMQSIIENFKQTNPTIQSYLKALKLRSMGFKDLIDLILYTVAEDNGLRLLTRDRELWKFIKSVGENVEVILLEEDFLKNYSDEQYFH